MTLFDSARRGDVRAAESLRKELAGDWQFTLKSYPNTGLYNALMEKNGVQLTTTADEECKARFIIVLAVVLTKGELNAKV